MSSFYYTYLKKLLELHFDDATCEYHLARFSLDNELAKIINATKEATQLQPLLADIGDTPHTLFETTLQNLEQQQNNIISFYEKCFEEKECLGDDGAYKNPDVIIVLGAGRTMLEIRTKSAITHSKTHPNSCVVLSGGGFSTTDTESDYMLGLVKKANMKNKILQETDSMDTFGNALFTKLLLKKEHMLQPNLRLLLITSQFHAPRALHYFDTVYKNSGISNIAAKGVKTTNKNIRALALHELLTEHHAESTIDIFEVAKRNQIDDTAILIKLFQHHNLYKNRYDLLRKYIDIAHKK